MAEYDRGDEREVRESPFQTLTKHIAGLKIQNGDTDSSEVEDEPKVVETIESLCISCEENGETRLLLTKIPYFREIILMSFSCPYCGFSNTEVQSAGQIRERGTKFTLKVTDLEDMDRQIIKSDTAVFRLEDLDVEMPAGHGQLTNIEGILNLILGDLEAGQRRRKKEEPELWEKIDAIVQPLLKMTLNQNFPFTITLDDPSGNSWIEPSSMDKDSKYQKVEYPRTAEQNESLGLGEAPDETNGHHTTDEFPPPSPNGLTAHVVPQIPSTTSPSDDTTTLEDVDILAGQNYSLPTACPGCTHPAHLNLQLLKIPYFKEIVVSAVMCLHCNYRSSDVKTGGEVPAKGKKIFLDVREPEDLRRDILKSETCCVKIEEIGVEVTPGTMGGRFTTVEGLLTQIRDDLKSTVFDVGDEEEDGGDSMPEDKRKAWEIFFNKIDEAIQGELQYTILLEDPLANSYVQNFQAPEPEPKIREEEYLRSEEVDEELGISDMRTRMGDGGEYEREEVQGGDAVAGGEEDVEAQRARPAELVSQATVAGASEGSRISDSSL
ncbi:MAG: hypothetical protein LQ343_003798 [Gyalolechia ehrenbergii]|nr:MAG: hypothetical protein LQ343_003798 [Gyalolechia ehrenbergii]